MIPLARLCQPTEALTIPLEVPPAEDRSPLFAYGILTTWRKRFLGPQPTCPPCILRFAPVLE